MNQHHHQQWHDVIAVQEMKWEDGPDDRAVLLVPRFRRGPLARWLQPRFKRPYIRVKLDEFGSFAWRRMDGTARFSEIAQAMRKHFGERVEPAEDRLHRFFVLLYRDKFIKLLTPAARS
ncbi:MAG: PqqD family protein [bacterium]